MDMPRQRGANALPACRPRNIKLPEAADPVLLGIRVAIQPAYPGHLTRTPRARMLIKPVDMADHLIQMRRFARKCQARCRPQRAGSRKASDHGAFRLWQQHARHRGHEQK